MYKITKRFTSRDGRLEPDEREYGISQEELNELGDARPHLGGAVHIFAKTVGGPSNRVRFFTRDNQHQIIREEKNHGWAEFEMAKSSTYKPHLGEVGWWNVRVEDAPSEVAEGIGLPDSWHVSTFVVFEWDADATGEIPEVPDEDGPEIPEMPDEEGEEIFIEVTINNKKYKGWVVWEPEFDRRVANG